MILKEYSLTPEEIEEVISKTMIGWAGGTADEDDVTIPRAIADAVVAKCAGKIHEWGEEVCDNPKHYGMQHLRHCCPDCWTSLKEGK